MVKHNTSIGKRPIPVENHATPTPETCDICAYVVERPGVDLRYEHGLVNLAGDLLIQDLVDAGGGPLPLRSLAVSTVGVEPGPVHRMEPRHWYWAMWHDRAVVLSLREGDRR